MEQIDRMTWRRFRALLRNLSPFGAVASQAETQAKDPENATPEEEERQAAAFFSGLVST